MSDEKIQVSQEDVRRWFFENPGWYTSREAWILMGMPGKFTFHNFRRRIQSLIGKEQLRRRIKHANYDKPSKQGPSKAGPKWSYRGPVYEYRRRVDVDRL